MPWGPAVGDGVGAVEGKSPEGSAETVGLLALKRVCLYALLMKSEHLVPSVGRTQPLSGPSLLVPSLLEALFQQWTSSKSPPPIAALLRGLLLRERSELLRPALPSRREQPWALSQGCHRVVLLRRDWSGLR